MACVSRETAWATLAAGALLALLGLLQLVAGLAGLHGLLAAAVAFLQLAWPLWRCEAQQQTYAELGLHRRQAWQECYSAALLACCCLPLYAWLTYAVAPPRHTALAWGALPAALHSWGFWRRALQLLFVHSCGVALPEEVFYRGYLQAQWQRQWPPRQRCMGVAWGGATLSATALFALGHFVGTWQPARLLTFFPGLLFAGLRNQRGSLLAAVLLHTACNVFAAGCAAFYD